MRTSHPGVRGIIAILTQYYWFRDMKAAARYVVRHCPDCIARKGRLLTKEVMAPDERPERLRGRWHIDGLQIPMSRGYNHLMITVVLRSSRG